MNYVPGGLAFWGLLLIALWLLRPRSGVLCVTMDKRKHVTGAVTAAALLLLVGLSSYLMTLCPMWNGTVEKTGEYGYETTPSRIVKNKNQYELMADAILEGHLYLEYEDTDPRLLEMENPYDPNARKEQQIGYHWDHAFYNGHYYMYFGVVPVFLLFIPFKLITGASLTTYHATQVFVGASVIGLFLFFRMMARKFFPRLPLAVYILMASAVSLASMIQCIAKPALYMTAFSAGICMEIWSVYCYVRAVWIEKDCNRALGIAFLGALFGALAFGCRPPIAIANLIVIPCLIRFIRQHWGEEKLILKLAAAASPYIVIGALLMYYNYVRFDSPFEFGQSYQLTVADQSAYSEGLSSLTFSKIINGLIYFFFQTRGLGEEFPFVTEGGILFTFPVFGTGIYALTNKKVRERLRSSGLTLLMAGGAVAILVIIAMDIVWSPYLLPRYREDMMWLMGMLMFIAVGLRYGGETESGEAVVAGEAVETDKPVAEAVVEAAETEEPVVEAIGAAEVEVPAVETVEKADAGKMTFTSASDAPLEAGCEAPPDDVREFSSVVSVLAIYAVLVSVILFVDMNMEFFTQDQLAWIMDAFMHIRLGIPLPVIEPEG